MVRSTTRQYTSAQRTYQPSRSLTSAETTHTSNTYPPYPSPIRPRTGYQRTPPTPAMTEHTTTPTPSNISPACSATQTAGGTSRSSRTDWKSPCTTQRCAQQTSQTTSKNDASSSSGSNYHSHQGRQMARLQTHPRSEEHTRCPCDHTSPEDLEHFRKCPLHTGRDTLVGWSPAETLRQHEGWPTHSHAQQATENLFLDPLVKEATMRGAVTQFLHRHLTKHTESPLEGSSAPPARGSPQSSDPNGTPQTPPVHTRGATHRPHRQGTHAASHPLPCRA